jgi:formyltetrahydrofolate dehydrogenase
MFTVVFYFLFYRLIEEIKDKLKITLQNEDLFMATTFKEFSETVVLKSRGDISRREVEHSCIKLQVNNMDVSFPHQLFINGEFVDSESGAVLESVNPSDESVICQVKLSSMKFLLF